MKLSFSRIVTVALLSLTALPACAASLEKPFYKRYFSDWFPSSPSGNWFVSGSAGIQRPIVDSRYTVPNGSAFAPPYNVDTYTTHIDPTAAMAFDAGYRWRGNNSRSWLPAYALGLRYAHSFSEDIGKQITQYSLPAFTNYNYRWDIYSDIFMVMGKVNLFEWRSLLPYLSAGAGFAFNTAAHYNESAFEGIIARESPQFARKTKALPAYSLGLGFDWHVKPAWLVSLGYEYQNLGTVSSGSGVGSWAGTYLRSGTYQTSSLILGVTWLIQ